MKTKMTYINIRLTDFIMISWCSINGAITIRLYYMIL